MGGTFPRTYEPALAFPKTHQIAEPLLQVPTQNDLRRVPKKNTHGDHKAVLRDITSICDAVAAFSTDPFTPPPRHS